ncbi:hypothetical protein, partial [Marinilactibacillus psychrotolerans]|uniref:hypothetical protein n=1 Tax=Marinilactibacillus psychrotolerans TaxID=191770 RepID=UPI0038838C86
EKTSWLKSSRIPNSSQPVGCIILNSNFWGSAPFYNPFRGFFGSKIQDVGEKSLASFFVSENRKQVSSPVE